MITTLTIFADSTVSVETVVKSNADPTGTLPYFALSAVGAVTPGSYVAGTWGVAYSATTDKATARSATVGGTGSHAIVSGTDYLLWCKVAASGDTLVEPVALIHCP